MEMRSQKLCRRRAWHTFLGKSKTLGCLHGNPNGPGPFRASVCLYSVCMYIRTHNFMSATQRVHRCGCHLANSLVVGCCLNDAISLALSPPNSGSWAHCLDFHCFSLSGDDFLFHRSYPIFWFSDLIRANQPKWLASNVDVCLRHCSLKYAPHANFAFFVRNFPIFLVCGNYLRSASIYLILNAREGPIVSGPEKPAKKKKKNPVKRGTRRRTRVGVVHIHGCTTHVHACMWVCG